MGCECSIFSHTPMRTIFKLNESLDCQKEEVKRLIQINTRKVPVLELIDGSKIMKRRHSLNLSMNSMNFIEKNKRKLLKQQTI